MVEASESFPREGVPDAEVRKCRFILRQERMNATL